VRNLAVYGDLFGTAEFERLGSRPGSEIGGIPLLLGVHPDLSQADRFWPSLARSAVGQLRWDDLRLPGWAYALAFAGGLVAAVLVVRWLRAQAGAADRRVALVFAATAVAYVAGIAWYALMLDYQPQGRYLLPALTGLAALAGASMGRRGVAVTAAVLLVLQLAAVGTVIHTFVDLA
jgi:hypothetical protein